MERDNITSEDLILPVFLSFSMLRSFHMYVTQVYIHPTSEGFRFYDGLKGTRTSVHSTHGTSPRFLLVLRVLSLEDSFQRKREAVQMKKTTKTRRRRIPHHILLVSGLLFFSSLSLG